MVCTTYGNIKETAVKNYVIELSQDMRMASSYLLTMPYTMSQKMKLFCDPQKLSSSKHVLQVKTEKFVLIQTQRDRMQFTFRPSICQGKHQPIGYVSMSEIKQKIFVNSSVKLEEYLEHKITIVRFYWTKIHVCELKALDINSVMRQMTQSPVRLFSCCPGRKISSKILMTEMEPSVLGQLQRNWKNLVKKRHITMK